MFAVSYGNKLDLNKMRLSPARSGGVNFVGRSSENHGVSATVAPMKGIAAFEAGLITVALGGTKLLASFVQQSPFYTAQNVAVLRPKEPMTDQEKIFYCICIRQNRFRYSAFGREANKTLRGLYVPKRDRLPRWVFSSGAAPSVIEAPVMARPRAKAPLSWPWFKLEDLFEIKKGKRLTKARMVKGSTPFIGAIDSNNGLTGFIDLDPLHKGNTITVNYNGNGVAEAFYQEKPFWCSDDVNVLYPKFELTPTIALFITTVIRLERFRFNYGRKWDLDRMRAALIRLPAKKDGRPDWKYMEQYVKSLKFSGEVGDAVAGQLS